MQQNKPKTYLIEKLKFKTANLAALMVIIFDHVIAILLFFIDVPENNKTSFNLLIINVLLPCAAGSLWYLFQYKKKENEDSTET